MNEFNHRLTLRAACLAILAASLWSGVNVSVKLSLAGVPPFALAGIRFIIGSAVILVWTTIIGVPVKLGEQDRRGLAQLAILFVVQIGFLYVGNRYTLASRATILNTTHPFFTAILAHIMLTGDRLSRPKIIGIVLSFSGVFLIFGESITLKDIEYLPGDLMVLTSGFLLGFRTVYIKRLIQGIHPGKLLFWQGVFSIPIFFVLSVVFEREFQYQITWAVVGGILYQGLVIAGFCFILWTMLLQRFLASRLGVFHFISPILGVVFSNLLLGDAISSWMIASMVLVGAGIAVVNYER